jgi:hypothetical protein
MPEPGTGHATITELQAAAATQRRDGLNDTEVRDAVRLLRRGGTWEAVQAFLANGCPPAPSDAAIERAKALILERAAMTNPPFYGDQ